MEQHLTVREARAFTSKSESTIKRLIREIVGTTDHPDRILILPSHEEVERRKATGDTFVWKLNRELLLKKFPKEIPVEEGSLGSKKSITDATDSVPIMEILRDQLTSKDRQIQMLETQLDRKDDQIKSLNERMHESNVLMKELQSKLSITAPKATESVTVETPTAMRPEKPEKGSVTAPKKPGLFRWFRS